MTEGRASGLGSAFRGRDDADADTASALLRGEVTHDDPVEGAEAEDSKAHKDGERDGMTPFSRAYFNTINDNVITHSPEAIRRKELELVDPTLKNGIAGLNESTFSVGTDVMSIMQPKNGVKIMKRGAEKGHGRYINSNESKMSLDDYQQMAMQHGSLATIALRGASIPSAHEETLHDSHTTAELGRDSIGQDNRQLNFNSGLS